MAVIIGQGTVFKKGTTAIGQLTSIKGVDIQVDTIETTVLDSVGSYKTFVAGRKDAGEIALEGFFDHTAHEVMLTDLDAGTSASYTIEFPEGTTTKTKWTFTALVTGMATEASGDDLVQFSCTLKISGKPTLTAGA